MTQYDPWFEPPRIARGEVNEPRTEAIPTSPATERIPTASAAQAYTPEPPPIVLRRARPAVFVAPAPQENVVVSRDLSMNRGPSKQPALSRNRKIAGNLPAWDPAPPGEIRMAPRRPSGGS